MISPSFVVPDCPIFHPTEEEWAGDPLAYIRNVVAPRAQGNAGIAKVVPPPSWVVPFSLPNEDSFRFRPRVQVLNALEATVRARGQFVTDLRVFNFWRGHPLSTPLPVGLPFASWCSTGRTVLHALLLQAPQLNVAGCPAVGWP